MNNIVKVTVVVYELVRRLPRHELHHAVYGTNMLVIAASNLLLWSSSVHEWITDNKIPMAYLTRRSR